jgi:nitrate/nitrite-specific signal transduction histidine kinase
LGTRPIAKFTRAAEAVGEGDYRQDFSRLISTRFPDEIATLAGVLSIMIEKVSQREASLKERVKALRIEIDEAKRQSEVKKIVESDSFRDLREKAKALRARRTTGERTRTKPGSENDD